MNPLNLSVLIMVFSCCTVACDRAENRLADSEQIEVRTTKDLSIVNVVSEPHLILELQSHWSNKQIAENTGEITFEYFIDGIVKGRLRYSKSGYLKILSKTDVPTYQLNEPEPFNAVLFAPD